jgi:hypothetical protein
MANELDVLAAKDVAVRSYLTPAQTLPLAAFAATGDPELNVVGVGVGHKTVEGAATGELSVRFYVDRKLPPGVLTRSQLLPAAIDGIPTDVVQTGRFHRHPGAVVAPAAANPNRQKLRPAHPGLSCGFRFPPPSTVIMAGTFGALVEDANGHYVLSNNHVLADENKLALGSPIFQPGLLDGGNAATDMIARLAKFIPISPIAMNHVDCAIARLVDPTIASPVFMPNVGALASVTPVAPAVGMKVIKTGRTTGSTAGAITDIHATVNVTYDMGPCQFDEQVIIVGAGGPFSAAGDSGSVIVQENPRAATALLFAGSATHTIANRLDAVLTALGVRLVIK